ncbi:MAG: hypothetical protein AB8B95_08455 [Pseudohongiellaceae bacterium]
MNKIVMNQAGIVLSLLLSSCSNQTNLDTRAGGAGESLLVPYPTDISFNEIMVAQIDHAAHFIWNAANPEGSKGSVDWEEVEHHAIQLLSSRSAMTLGGTGVNDAMWVVQSDWRRFVGDMNSASLQALRASRSRSISELGLAGDNLVESCEGCHRQFKPSIPTEGLLHPH